MFLSRGDRDLGVEPKILSKNEPIPPSALVKPNANDAQVLMWRPKFGPPLVVIPPKHR